ncbi:MAG: bacillithiol biosynthesis cysteine-adding enzyme BshC [Acidobacteria bacterium]|nr:bacillithiol biosynthesis cysteine-adding enzyme BshC [Acidobacteriota bacterium]
MSAPQSNPSNNDILSQLSISQLPFTQIPNSSKLYLDYLYDSTQVIDFYPSLNSNNSSNNSPTNSPLPKSLVETVLSNSANVIRRTQQRDLVANILKEQNQVFGCSEKALQNIELLKDPSTVAIITGQQAGLFGGPLYSVYKALTAIKLAEELNLKGQKAIPIFWIASEDHDYEEVSFSNVINREGHLNKIKHEAKGNLGNSSIGNLTISQEIEENISQLFASLPQSEFVSELEKELCSAYSIEKAFAKAFGQIITNFFTKYGLVLIDPMDTKLKQLAAPIFEQAINKTQEIAQALVNRSQELESKGYHAQVYTSLDMVTFFTLENEHRSALRHNEENFTLKHSSFTYTKEDLLAKLKADPSNFSPNVMLRPIIQDYLLPTAVYIGGPAEVAYFAQISAIYKFFPVEFPIILARNSFTVIQHRDSNLLKKWGLEFTDLFAGLEVIKRKVLENNLDQEIIQVFDETNQVLQSQLDKLQNSLVKIDPTLAEALRGGKEKIFYQINNLHTRFINSNAKRQETLVKQIERTFNVLYPHKNLQERELNIYHFLARYGVKFIDLLYKNTSPENKNHLILSI